MTYNAFNAIKDVVMGTVEYVPKAVADQRLTLCAQCPEKKAMDVCGQCGCYIPQKVKFALSECPLKKW